MPNLRGKTWTTTTPANVGDAQYWEDHLISDAVAAKAASSVQSVNNTAPDAQGNVDIVALPDGGTAGQVLTKQSSVDGDADWEDPASSGHTIQDEDGNDMPYQDTLQFVNAEVTNDTTDGKTVVACKGAKGDPGDAATITVGTVTTLPAGSQATVVNTGTSADAVFNFGIPKGADGSGVGDMTKAEYATNGEAGVVDEAVTLKGLTASIADLNKTSSLATVATSGSYSDLTNQPTIPIVEQTYSATSGNAQSGTAVAEVVEQIYADNGVLGAKNLLEINMFQSPRTVNGITLTKNSDGSISVSGTSTSVVATNIAYFDVESNVKYILTGTPDDIVDPTNNYIRAHREENTYVWQAHDNGNGVVIQRSNSERIWIDIRIAPGTTINTTFYPMLRLASDSDDTYVPYAMTNRELTEDRYYHTGDTVNVSLMNFAGLTTNSSKEIRFTIPLMRDLSKITGITFKNTTSVGIRKPGGGYVIDGTISSGYTITILAKAGNLLSLKLTKTDDSAFDATNNTPLDVAFTGGSNDSVITFS